MKRVISLFMAVLLIISTVPISNVWAAADVTKPVFESLSVDKKEAGPGDTVNVSAKVTDDVGIKSVSLYYKVPGTDRTIKVPGNYNPETSTFEGWISIPSDFAAGVYQVSYIDIWDTSNNQTAIFQSDKFDNASFTVSGTSGADITKPVFESLSVDKKEAGPGDTVNVSAKVTDDVGIKSVSLYYKVPGTDRTIKVPGNYNPETSTFEGWVSIPSDFAAGVYQVSYIDIWDTSNNQTAIFQSSKFDNASFTVSGTSGADITKPIFESLTVDKTNATFGDQVNVRAKVTDDVGIKSVSLYYKVPGTSRTFKVPGNYNPETGNFEGWISIPSDFAAGVYQVSYIDIWDTSNNQTAIFQSSKFDNGVFSVFTESNPPSFSSLSIDKKVAEAGDTVHFTVDADDDTNLQGAKVNLVSPVSQSIVSVPLAYDGTRFSGNFSIDGNTEVGDWKVSSVEVKDTNSNTTVVDAAVTDLSAGKFTVIKGVEPLNSYVVTSNETWSNKTVNTDVYIVPGARLTINGNVTITGNVYILGGLRVYGGLRSTGSLIGSSFTFGYYTPVNGQGVISGTNSISSLVATNRVISTVPFEMYNQPLVSSGGRVSLSGATLPFVAMEVNGQSVPLKANGTFRLNDFYIGDSPSVSVKLTDLAGYSYYHSYDVADLYVDEFTKDSTALTGKTLANAVVKVFEDGELLASGNTDADGYFSIPVNGLVENTTLTFEIWNAANERTTSKEIFVKDLTAPGKAVVNEVTDSDTTVTGHAEAKAVVEVRRGDAVIGTDTVAADGTFSVVIPKQFGGAELTVNVKDAAGNVSEATTVVVKDVSAPEKPIVSALTDADRSVKGQAEPESTVKVSVNGSVIGSGTADADGSFDVAISKLVAGTEVVVTATDKVGNVSEAASVVVKDGTAPVKPLVGDAVTDQDTAVDGTTEAGAKVEVKAGGTVIGYGDADDKGSFSIKIPVQKAGTSLTVTATDVTGNVSEAAVVVVKDVTKPGKPVVHEVTDKDTVVSGLAEVGATVAVTVGGSEIGSGTVVEDGSFTVAIPVQMARVELKVTVTDAAGNVSEATVVVVRDVTVPEKPIVDQVLDKDEVVTGKSEPGAKMVVSKSDGTEVGSAVAGSEGYFSIQIPKQKAGTELTITATDKGGNVSEFVVVTVKDGTAPATPVIDGGQMTDQTTLVKGKTEAGAIVEVYADDHLIGSGVAGSDGRFAVTIPKQKGGVDVFVTATDAVGNVSNSAVMTVIDVTAPVKPVVNEVNDRAAVMTGQAEAGSFVEVSLNNFNVIGNGFVGEDGKFSVKIATQPVGTEINVTVSDAYGNMSPMAKVVVVKAKSGWVKVGTAWYYYDTATFVKKVGWFKVGSSWYYADGTGAMKTGWVKDGSSWYFMNSSGAMVTGWLKVGTTWYFFNGSGAMATGWMKAGSVWYFFTDSGAMKTGWMKSGSTWYYFASSGAMQVGWLKVGTVWYYFTSGGAMVTGNVTIGGKPYVFNENGVWVR
ncbi:hypothetical protein QE429_000571 [Bacillus sp. SORGH_AS 510]|uniref:Ig-like domain-containing protein n=1 Tax=Bacillus sp. SORGH_AS_0510 TaxID=3041771 RepID=UPI0027897EA4|nr:Ig-like domain-containing protein [Bacillus sp. SORGH_AS_0510]MDQ1143744.1 hypothetical protein [Bacillus sp. SORGH_AS_0510]